MAVLATADALTERFADRDHAVVAVTLELERAFGGWLAPPQP